MQHNLTRKEIFYLGGLVFVAFILKCYFSYKAPLLDDEVYYYLWSKKPDFGYPEHGPFLPWIYALISPLLGESALAIRFFGLIGMQFVSVAVFLFMKNRFGIRTAWTAFLIYQLLPATFTMSIVSTIDTPMFIFGTLALLFYAKGFFEKNYFFYVGGLFLGIAALSKVSAIWLGIGMLFYIIISVRRLEYLKNFHLWISFIFSALIYSPFLIWNYSNDFPFFVTATNLLSRKSSVESFIMFWISQILLLFPTIFILCFHALKIKQENNPSENRTEYSTFFSVLGIVALMYIFYQSLKSNLEANWGGFAYISLLLLVPIHITSIWKKFRMGYVFPGSLILSTLIMFTVLGHTLFDFWEIKKNDITNRYYAFSSFPGEIKEFYDTQLKPEIRTISYNNYQIPSMLEYHLKPLKPSLSINGPDYHPVIFEYWYQDIELTGQDLYILQKNSNELQRISKDCEDYSLLKKFSTMRDNSIISEFYLYSCKQFSGKIRKLPTLLF